MNLLLNAEYEKLIRGLYDRGIEKLNVLMNKGYQQNCKEYESKNQKVNLSEGLINE